MIVVLFIEPFSPYRAFYRAVLQVFCFAEKYVKPTSPKQGPKYFEVIAEDGQDVFS